MVCDSDSENDEKAEKSRVFYVLLIWTGVQLALITFLIPETYAPVLLRRRAQRLRKETGNTKWQAGIEKLDRTITKTVMWSCIRPFQLLFFEPMVLNLCLLSALLLGILYLFFGAFPLIFENNHHFKLYQVGLSFLGLFVGEILGILSDFFWQKNYARLVREREAAGGEPGGTEPEFRLPPTIFGAFMVTVGLFGFGWTTFSSVGLSQRKNLICAFVIRPFRVLRQRGRAQKW